MAHHGAGAVMARASAAGALLPLLLAAQATAQTPDWLFPDRALLPSLLAAPREPATSGRVVYADPDPTRYGAGVSGEVSISGTVPVILLAGEPGADRIAAGADRRHGARRDAPGSRGGNALVIGLEGAAFAHFSFEVVTRELVNTDWLFAVPLVWRIDDDWVRLRYYHTSSHLGDEYQRRFGPSSINFARDGAELTAYLRPGLYAARRLGLGAYAGVLWSPNSHPEEGTVWRGRAGLEVDPKAGANWQPYGALDVEIEERSAHGARWTVQGGIWVPAVAGRPLRLALELMAGPSVMGQFSRRETRRAAIALVWNP